MSEFRFGFITVIGKPNVGKSTLINQMVGEKISITSHRPQTTRHRILGIYTDDNKQMVFVDTPGIHSLRKKSNRKAMNKLINKTAVSSIDGVDVVCLMITAKGWQDEDYLALDALKKTDQNVILVINKVDRLDSINDVLPLIQASSEKYDFKEIVPVSASKGSNVEHLMTVLSEYLPQQDAGFDEDQITDRSYRFLVAELVREQLFRRLGDELPYSTAIDIHTFKKEDDLWQVGADIWVERDSHKGIVIGNKGETLKKVGEVARKNSERLLGEKVFMELWVKVRSGWSDNARDLHNLGYDELV